jgi:DNA-binding NtrC family response regulator
MDEHKILLVDDDPVAIETVTGTLKGNGYNLTITGDGKSAIDLIIKEKFDLILSELVVGSFDGLEILNKSKEINPATGTIIITAKPERINATDLIELDIDAYLFKPCDPEKILTCVNHCIEQSRMKSSGADTRRHDRRKKSDPNYTGPERRKGHRRKQFF